MRAWTFSVPIEFRYFFQGFQCVYFDEGPRVSALLLLWLLKEVKQNVQIVQKKSFSCLEKEAQQLLTKNFAFGQISLLLTLIVLHRRLSSCWSLRIVSKVRKSKISKVQVTKKKKYHFTCRIFKIWWIWFFCKREYSNSCMYQITLEFLSMFVFYENKLVLNEMFSHNFRPQCSSKKRDWQTSFCLLTIALS